MRMGTSWIWASGRWSSTFPTRIHWPRRRRRIPAQPLHPLRHDRKKTMKALRHSLFSTQLLALALVCAAGVVQAQPGGKPAEEPDTLILSDTLNYDDVKKESIFTGNVIMTRGLMTLHSDKLIMREDAEGFQHGTATVGPGKLVHIRQEDPAKFEVIEAPGLRSEYTGTKEELEMIGQAVIHRYDCGKPFNNVKGKRVIYRQ